MSASIYKYCSLLLSLYLGSLFLGLCEAQIIFENKLATPPSSTLLPVYQNGEILYLEINSLAKALGFELQKDSSNIVIKANDKFLKLQAGNCFIMVNDDIYQLITPVIVSGDRIFIHFQPFSPAFDKFFPGSFFFQNDKIVYRRRDCRIQNITASNARGKILCDILSTKAPLYTQIASPNNELKLLISNGAGDESELNLIKLPGIDPLRCRELAEGFEIALNFNPFLKIDTIYTLPENKGLRIELIGYFASETRIDNLNRDQKAWRYDVIILDPGHGGADPGAIGQNGLKEKDVTLDIAVRLEKLLKNKLKVKTVLTRRQDEFIPLNQRGLIANQAGGKLFVSIHANACRDRRANGVEVYFLSPAKTEQALEVAKLENASIEYENDRSYYKNLEDVNHILLSMTKSNDLKESEALAGFVQERFKNNSGLKSRGVDQAGFYVLYGANMPSILFETAFISNPREEKLLRSKQFRQKVAEILFDSIKDFCQVKEKEL